MQREGGARRFGLWRAGLFIGVVVASAALGALVVFAYHGRTPVFDSDLGPPVGALVHLLLCIGWAVIFTIVAWPWRGARVLAVAFVVSGVAWALSATVLPPALRLGNGLYASPQRAAIVHALVALALAGGMRLARE